MVRLMYLQNRKVTSSKSVENESQLLLTKYLMVNLNQISTMILNKRKYLTFSIPQTCKKSQTQY